MARLPHGGTTLVDQVLARRKNAKWSIEGEPDGYGTNREVAFDKTTSKWLQPLLEAVQDPRIESFYVRSDRLFVNFVEGNIADSREPFALDEADAVLNN